MARSRHRHKHHPHHPVHVNHPNVTKHTARKSAVGIMVVFVAVLGLGVAFVSAGADIIWLIVGTLAGGIAGYFFGRSIDNSAAKK